MRKLLAVTVVLAVSSWASADVVLVDNIGDQSELTGNTHAAQNFESTYDAYDCAVIDDFDVSGDGWRVTEIEAMVGFWNGTGDLDDVDTFNIGIFSDSSLIATTLVGDVAHITGAAYDDSDVDTGWAHFTVDLELDDAGTYWVMVQPDLAYASYGQCGIMSTFLGNLNGVQGNPNGGFGISGNMQTIQYDDEDVSAAYLVRGVPEPAGLVLLGLGALLIRRR